MVSSRISRRHCFFGLIAFGALPTLAAADQVIDLNWEDLLPETGNASRATPRGVVQHGETPFDSQEMDYDGVRSDWNGKTVRLPGFMVPIDYTGAEVTAFILVPYFGACVHVPPPPPNQLVFVTTEKPYESNGLFEAVNVTGIIDTDPTSTRLAEIGYSLSADRVENYEW